MQICGVPKCGNSSLNGFFKINMLNADLNSPDYQLEANRQRDWLNVMNIRLQIVQNPALYNLFEHRLYVCPKHFVSGKPAPLHDFDNMDWIPTVNMPNLDEEFLVSVKNYKCNQCPQWYKSQDGVLRHMVSHSDDEIEEFMVELESEDVPESVIESQQSTLNKINEKMSSFDWCACAKCAEIIKLLDEHLIAQHSDADQDNTIDALSDHAYISPKKQTDIHHDDVKEEEPAVVKKICFKVVKVGGKKLFACQFCEIKLENREDMFDHFKSHLTTAAREREEQNSSPIIKENGSNEQEVITKEDEKVSEVQKEFQCAVCATVDTSQEEILNCVRQHVHSGWPKKNNSGLVWEMAGTKVPQGVDEEQLCKIALELNRCHTNYDPIYFRCSTCQRYFDEMEEFQKHMATDHGQSMAIAIDNIVRVMPVIKCLKCALDNGDFLTFLDIETAMEHRKLHHFQVVDAPPQPIQRVVISTDESQVLWTEAVVYFAKNPITESFQCPCQKLYEFKSAAFKCLAQHVGIRRFRCEEEHLRFKGKKCKISFFSYNDLAKHKEKFHQPGSEDCTNICHVCGKLCKRQTLAAHIRQAHRKYKCLQCTKSYENNAKLLAHVAGVHKRIKKYNCRECHKSFVWQSSALVCEARHRKLLRCEYCDAEFAKLYEKIGHVADCHPMFSSGDGGGGMGADFNMHDLSDFEV